MNSLESPFDNVLQEDLDKVTEIIEVDKLKNASVLVTGATGLIGVSIARTLLCLNRKKNTNIKIFLLIRNEKKAQSIYGNLLSRPEMSIVVADVTEKINIDFKIDYIFHCASITSSKEMIEHPVETLNTSIEGTNNILKLATEKQVKSVVYVSSMEMYGTFKEGYDDVTEQDLGYINPLAIRSNYPESKRVCENMCVAYYHEYGVNVKIARLAQTFGAGILQGENRVFAQFARSVINNQDIVLHTKGLSEGNYCYTRDAIAGLFTILLKGTNGEAYNVANPMTHTTINNMAEMVSQKIASGQIKVIYDIPDSNKFGYAADTKMKLNSDKLQRLGWKPEIDLEEAYRRLIKSMENKNNEESVR